MYLLASVSEQGELSSVCSELNGKLSEKNDFMHLVIAHSEVNEILLYEFIGGFEVNSCKIPWWSLQIDMVEVKEEYKKQYQRLFADDIKKYYDGNLQKILLGLIKGCYTWYLHLQ